MLRQVALALAATSFVALSATAHAALLNPNSAIIAPGEPDPVGGTILANSGPVAFTAATFSGTLTSEVILNDPSNPFGPGFLTFTYLIHNDATSANSLGRFTVSDFTPFLTDVSYQAPAAGTIPTSVDRNLSGSVVGFSFTQTPLGLGEIPAGQNSALLVIQTNATIFDTTHASLIDGSVASVLSFAPLSDVAGSTPEPASLSLLALAAPLLLRRRK